ncbi:hypothetical protein LTR27_007589 [Elasticomyces elasticus]|nr:hypothetical protein LTR27_007589 [Elasticomyces elasticus]
MLIYISYSERTTHRTACVALRDFMAAGYETTKKVLPQFSSVCGLDRITLSGAEAVQPQPVATASAVLFAVDSGQAWITHATLLGSDGALASSIAELPVPPGYYHGLSIAKQHDLWINNGFFDDNFTQIYSPAQGVVQTNRVPADLMLEAY